MNDLTRIDAAEYQRQGWAKIAGGLISTAELEELRSAVDKLAAFESDARAGSREPEDGKRQTGARVEGLDARYQMMFKIPGYDLRLNNPVLMSIARKYGELARHLLGEDVRVWYDHILTKPPAAKGTRPTVWHQDLTYFPVDRRGMLVVWTPLYDVPLEAGCMRYIPRSHRLGPLGKLPMNSDYELADLLRPTDYEIVGEPVSVPLKAGECAVHDGLTLHGAYPNNSDKPRVAWTMAFGPISALVAASKFPIDRLNSLGLKELEPLNHPTLRVE